MSTMHQTGHMPWDRNGNRILIQSQTGRAKPSTYNLPEQIHTYGKYISEDPQKAHQLMYDWKAHQAQPNPNLNRNKDFIETNRQCIRSLLHTATDYSKFRKTGVSFQRVKEGCRLLNINLPEENFVYGKPLEEADPIKMVIANHYGETDRIARHTFYKTQQFSQSQAKRKLSCYITKNHNLAKEANSKKMDKFKWELTEPSLWKMNKFKNIQGKTNTMSHRNARSSLAKTQSAII